MSPIRNGSAFADPLLCRARHACHECNASTIVTTGQMIAERFDHAAVLLPTGRVLIVGGLERNGVTPPSAELFDPATGTLHGNRKAPSTAWLGFTATLLRNGKVLVAGGGSFGSTASAELYDPATGTFAVTGKMTVPRAEAHAVLLRTGEVLLVGGTPVTENNPVLSAEFYHPSTGTFSSLGATHLSALDFGYQQFIRMGLCGCIVRQ